MLRLTVACLLLVGLVASAALALPAFVDWRDYQPAIAARAQTLTGRRVTLAGAIDFTLLPRPTLTVARAAIGDGEQGDLISVDRLELEVSLLPLLRGEVEVRQATLVRPVLTVAWHDGLAPSVPQPSRLPLRDLRLDGVQVVDGRVVISGGADPPLIVEEINLNLSAESVVGPFAVTGEARLPAAELPLSFAGEVGRTDRSSVPLHLDLTAAVGDRRSTASYRGSVRPDADAPDLRGSLTLAGGDLADAVMTLARAAERSPPALPAWLAEPYTLNAEIRLDGDVLALGDAELQLGETLASAALQLELADRPRLDLELAVARVDLPADALEEIDRGLLPPVPAGLSGEVDVVVDALGYGDSQAQRIQVALALPGDGTVAVNEARARLPGNTSVSFVGDGAGGTGLRGTLRAASENLRAVADWLEIDLAGVPNGRLRSFALGGEINLQPNSLRLLNAELRLDASTFLGSLGLDFADRTRLAVTGVVDRLNADVYLPGDDVPTLPPDWRDALLAVDVAADLQFDRLTLLGQRVGGVHFAGDLVTGFLTVEELSIDDLAGASGRLVGSIGFVEAGAVDVALELSAERPSGSLRRLGVAAPPALARLAPLNLTVTAQGAVDDLDLEVGVAAADARLAIEGAVGGKWPDPEFELALRAGHPEAVALLRQLGAVRLPDAALDGPLRLEGTLRNSAEDGWRASLDAGFGDTAATGTQALRTDGPRPELHLKLSAGSVPVPVLSALAALADAGNGGGAWAWQPGDWSRAPLRLQDLAAYDGTVEVTIDEVRAEDWRLGDLGLNAVLAEDRIGLLDARADALGGSLRAAGLVELGDAAPFWRLELDLDGLSAAEALSILGIPPTVSGAVDLTGRLTAGGASAQSVVRTLDGTLDVELRDGAIDGLDLAALRRAVAAAPDAVGEAARAGLSSGTTRFDWLGGSLRVENGILRTLTGLHFAPDGASARVDGAIDLLLWALDLTLEVTPGDDAPNVGLRLVGPLSAPQAVPLTAEIETFVKERAAER